MSQRTRAHHSFALRLLASGCSVVAVVSAQAQETARSPYYVGISQTFSHDSNVFRSPTNEVSEMVYVTSLLGGIDQPIGRQRVYGDAVVQIQRHRNVERLNNKSYALNAGFDWETIETLSGSLRYGTRNSLADLGGIDGTGTISDVTTNQFEATARYGLASSLRLEVGYDYRELEYNAPSLASRNYSQNSVDGAIRWTTGSTLTLGLGVRGTRGETPQYQTTPPYADETSRRDVDLTAVWTPTALSTVNARLSATRERHTLNRLGDISATTGSLAWNYRPGARLTLNTTISRDTGIETAFDTTTTPTTPGTTALTVDNNRLTDSATFDATYSLTSKIFLNAGVRWREGTSQATSSNDTVKGYNIGFSYQPTRSITTNCGLVRESRSVSGVVVVGTGPYKATITSCAIEFSLR